MNYQNKNLSDSYPCLNIKTNQRLIINGIIVTIITSMTNHSVSLFGCFDSQ
jgi:hypothetical protein